VPSRCANACIPVLSWAKNEEHETAGLVAQGLDASSVTRVSPAREAATTAPASPPDWAISTDTGGAEHLREPIVHEVVGAGAHPEAAIPGVVGREDVADGRMLCRVSHSTAWPVRR